MTANARLKSAVLVSLQFGLIALLMFTTAFNQLLAASYALIVLACCLLAWAVWSMQQSKLRISPVPDAAAVLITSGPYRFIRHPMYTSILLAASGLLVADFSLLRLLMFAALAAVLIIKLNWEEKMLALKFSAYAAYQRKSARLMPFLF